MGRGGISDVHTLEMKSCLGMLLGQLLQYWPGVALPSLMVTSTLAHTAICSVSTLDSIVIIILCEGTYGR